MAHAPSLIDDALPAVTVPSFLKGVGSLDNPSTVVSARICSSSVTSLLVPFGSRHADGHDFRGKDSGLLSRCSLLL